jgi:hypothetical protein
VTTLDNDDIDISLSHILLFPKIYNLAVCQLLRQISKNRYPATLLYICCVLWVCTTEKKTKLDKLGMVTCNEKETNWKKTNSRYKEHMSHCLMNRHIISMTIKGLILSLWCLTPLSTIFQLNRGGQVFFGGRNRSIRSNQS